MHLESKNAKSLVMADVEVGEPDKREIGNDSSELVYVSTVKPRRGFLFRD
jgi:hypothetical protein